MEYLFYSVAVVEVNFHLIGLDGMGGVITIFRYWLQGDVNVFSTDYLC
jgi:hypothetical protein